MRRGRQKGAFLAMFCILTVYTAFAQDSLYSHPAGDEDLKSIDAICESITGSGVVRGDFSQTKEIKKISRTLKSGGTFVISRDDGIIWNTVRPFPMVMVVGEAGISQAGADGNFVSVRMDENPVFVQFSRAIQSVFTGNRRTLFESFQVYADVLKPVAWRIGLIPGMIPSAALLIELSCLVAIRLPGSLSTSLQATG